MADNDKIQFYRNPRPHRRYPAPPDVQAFYSSDSTARQIEAAYPEPAHQPERDFQPTPVPVPVPRPKKRQKSKTKPVVETDIQARHRHNFLSYVLVLAFFGGLVAILALNARFEYERVSLEAERTHLAALQSGNVARASEIYATLDLEQIELFAIEHLGMIPPEDFQLVEIVVSPQSFFSAAPTDTPTSGSFSLNRFWDVLFAFETDSTYYRED